MRPCRKPSVRRVSDAWFGAGRSLNRLLEQSYNKKETTESGAGQKRGPDGSFCFPFHRTVSRVKHCCRFALPHLKRYPTQVVASTRMLPKTRRRPRGWRHEQDGKAGIIGDTERPFTGTLPRGTRAESWTSSSRLPDTTASTASGCSGCLTMMRTRRAHIIVAVCLQTTCASP